MKCWRVEKKHRLKYKDIVLPAISNLKDGYHTNCSTSFLALMKKYYDNTSRKAQKEDEPFQKRLKNCDPSTLPPCKVELHQHLLRAQYITSIWRNAYLRFPSSLTPDRNGWTQNGDTLEFHWFARLYAEISFRRCY